MGRDQVTHTTTSKMMVMAVGHESRDGEVIYSEQEVRGLW